MRPRTVPATVLSTAPGAARSAVGPGPSRSSTLSAWIGSLGCIALLGLLGATGCGPTGEPEEPTEPTARPSVTNEELGITLTEVPAGFRVERNEAGELVLERTGSDDAARLEFLVGPVQSAGVNLVDQVWEEKTRIESLPDGQYGGQNELAGAAIGTVYTSRGRFVEDGEPVEEYRALAVHPGQNRLLILDYEYPPAENTGERLNELMQVIEVVEAAGGAGGEAEAS